MKHRIISLLVVIPTILLVLMSGMLGFLSSYLSVSGASALIPAGGGGSPPPTWSDSQYTVYYPTDTNSTNQILDAEQNGMSSQEASGVFSQTFVITRGGPLGTGILHLDTNYSADNDVPTYFKDYYCMPTENYAMSWDEPTDPTVPYVRMTLGIGIGGGNGNHDFATPGWFVNSSSYYTYQGLHGENNVGSVYFPLAGNSTSGYTNPAATFDLPGQGGDIYIRSNVDPEGYAYQSSTVANYNMSQYDPGFTSDMNTVFNNCQPHPAGNPVTNATNYNKLPSADKKSWDQTVKAAGLGDTVADAASNAGSSSASSGSASVPSLSCNAGLNPLNWLICGIVSGLVSIIGDVDNIINSELSVGTSSSNSDSPNAIFCDPTSSGVALQTCNAYEQAWSSFRDIALGLLVVVGLVIVISQALGSEVLDAYTVRKALPRLLIAAIGITLSWPLMKFFVTLTNDLGYGIRNLIYAPFSKFTNTVNLGGGNDWAVTLATGTAITVMGIFGLLSFAATAALALFVGFLVLVLRQLVIIVLIILAPVAILMYILPNTQHIYKLWWESFSKALLMFPIIAALIASGRVFSAVAAGQTNNPGGGDPLDALIAFAAFFAPYFILPLTFKFAGGALRQIGGFVNDRGRGGFDRLRNFRAGQAQKNTAALKAGKRYEGKKWIPGSIAAAGAFNATTKGVGTGWTGRFGLGERGKMARANANQAAAAEALKSPGMQSISGYNDANRILAMGFGDERRGRAELKHHLMNGGDTGHEFYSEAEADEKVNKAAKAAKLAGGFSEANGIAAFQNMARDGTAIRSTSDLAYLAARVGGGDRNNTFKYAAEAASISRQVNRSDLAAASEPIGSLAFAYSDIVNGKNGQPGGLYKNREDPHATAVSDMDRLQFDAWKSGAGGEVAYNKYGTAKARVIRNDTNMARHVLKDFTTNGAASKYTDGDAKAAAAMIMESKMAVQNSYGKQNNRETFKKTFEDVDKDGFTGEKYLQDYLKAPSTGTKDVHEKVVNNQGDIDTTRLRPVTKQRTKEDDVMELVGQRMSMSEDQRQAGMGGGPPGGDDE